MYEKQLGPRWCRQDRKMKTPVAAEAINSCPAPKSMLLSLYVVGGVVLAYITRYLVHLVGWEWRDGKRFTHSLHLHTT